MGSCVCKNYCERIAIKVFAANAYDGNCYCTRCSVWLKLSDLEGLKCPCCKQRARQKKRYLRSKEIKRID